MRERERETERETERERERDRERERERERTRHLLTPPFTPQGSVSAADVPIPVPGGRWRLGLPCPHAKALLIRFTSRNDHKLTSSEMKAVTLKQRLQPAFKGKVL